MEGSVLDETIKDKIMKEITLEELLEAGCHFGHQVTRGNPKARDYIFEARDNIHIIDLAKTKTGLEEAGAFIRDQAAQNKVLVIVGTKRQARGIVEEEVKRAIQQIGEEQAGLFSVTNRWIGGILTNFSEVSKNFEKLKNLSKRLEDKEEKAKFTKKEIGLWYKGKLKLEALYGGIYNMKQKPDMLFIIDSHLEDLVVREALRENVKTVAIVDTNANPEVIDYPIPANDDATGSIKLITHYIIDAWIEGKNLAKKQAQKKEVAKSKDEEVKKTQSAEIIKKESKEKTINKKTAAKKGKTVLKKKSESK